MFVFLSDNTSIQSLHYKRLLIYIRNRVNIYLINTENLIMSIQYY